MVDGAEDLLCKDILRNEVFPDCSSKVQKEVQLQQISKQESKQEIFKLVKKFETHGTCGDRRVTGSSPSGPPITIRTPDNVTRVQESVGRSPSKSLRRRSQELGISVSSVSACWYWVQTVADYKMLSFHLSINVIIIVVSFKILDLCPILLFQQLWNTLYICAKV